MKSSIRLICSVLIIGCLFAVQACSDDPASPGEGSQATIHGSISDNSSENASVAQSNLTGIEGITVAAARIDSDGSFQTIADTETETDASGEFTLFVDTDAAEHIAVFAETESEQWAGFLSKEVENGHTYTLKPIDTESSAETEVMAILVTTGHTNIVQKADIEIVITASNAADVSANNSVAAGFASGLTNSAQARTAFIGESVQENPEEAMSQAAALAADAQFQLEADLASSTSTEQRESAYDSFKESVVEAYTNAGLVSTTVAKTFEMWGRTFLNSTSSISTEVENEARSGLSMMTAIAIDKAVRAEAEAAGMSEATTESISDAGTELKGEIKTSAGVESEIEAAFEKYHDDVRTAMENDSSVEASVIVAVDADINATAGYKSIFNTAISGTVSSDLVIEIYNSFFNSIYSAVESEMETADETQVEAVTHLMILINLAS